ncbi:pentatricopeptide repeat-containing protein [Carex littledalei]|uniref:Pentatricopeptide repeat-containing protein n=1 Tax=Carex littledalei TaxID=544730 RepID=A0A833RD45_9POAL|nr:pentatricopeptide repeat-containing protein [Carex littledalei]
MLQQILIPSKYGLEEITTTMGKDKLFAEKRTLSAGHLFVSDKRDPLRTAQWWHEDRDEGRSKNRKPTQRGRYLSSEAIQAVQFLKRSKSVLLLQGDPPGSEGAGAREKVQRLIKKDMVAAMRELLSQDEPLLALFVFEEIRKEHWYRPQLTMYLDIISVLTRLNLQRELEQTCSCLKREYYLEADTERFNLLIGVLMESGFVHLAMDCY